MATLTIRGRFIPGTKVFAVRQRGDHPPTAIPRNAEQVATTNKDSETTFKNLTDGGHYWAVAEIDGAVRAVALYARPDDYAGESGLAATRHASQQEAAAQAQLAAEAHAEAVKKDPLANSPALGGPDESHNVVTGSRSTANIHAQTAGEPSKSKEQEPQPHLRQEDLPKGTAQRSDTLTGQATPKDPKEAVPRVRQEDVPASTPQRSSTETGEAAIKDLGEEVPVAKQEDVPKGVKQRSDTETGEAAPKPRVSKVEAQKRKDSSAARARGRTPDKPEERAKPKAPAKKLTRTGTAARKKSK